MLNIMRGTALADPIPEVPLTARPRNYSLQDEILDRDEVARELGLKPNTSIFDLAARGDLDDDYVKSLIRAAE